MSSQPARSSLRRTAADLARHPGPRPALGDYLWEATREVRFRSPVRAVSGRLGKGSVFHVRGGKTFERRYVKPADPRTVRQLDQRTRMTAIQRHWKSLTPEQRLGWGRYGAEHLFPERRGEAPGGLGLNAYMKAQSMRLGWGGELGSAPPVGALLPAPVRLVEVAAPEAGQLAFRVEHSVRDVAGCRLVVEMTPATPNGRKPRSVDLRRAGETAAESFFPLGESGDFYLLERPRFVVAAGERFALAVRLVTSDGIPGEELMADLLRGDGEGGEESAPEMGGDGADGEEEVHPGRLQGVAGGADVAVPADGVRKRPGLIRSGGTPGLTGPSDGSGLIAGAPLERPRPEGNAPRGLPPLRGSSSSGAGPFLRI